MESNIKASFIPDKMPARSSGGRSPQPSSGGIGDILILIAIVVLAAALALAAGVFLYDRFLMASVQKKSEQLERARQAFEPALIQELVRLDSRLQAADDVLARHLAPSELFTLLEELTLESISYDSMTYSVSEDDGITLNLKGKARSVNGVALQASVFGQHNAIVNPIFSDLDLVSDGVAFKVTSNINPSSIRYSSIYEQYLGGGEFTEFDEFSTQEFDASVETESTGVPAEGFGEFGAGQEAGTVTQ